MTAVSGPIPFIKTFLMKGLGPKHQSYLYSVALEFSCVILIGNIDENVAYIDTWNVG